MQETSESPAQAAADNIGDVPPPPLSLTCRQPTCRRTELVDTDHPNYAAFLALAEPRRVLCSTCACAAFTF